MEKFIECLKNRKFQEATYALKVDTNRFGYSSLVPDRVSELQNECLPEAEEWAVAFIKAVADKFYVDGRCEKCVNTAKMLIQAGLTLEDSDAKVDINGIHPTIIQQMSQLAFLFVETIGLIKYPIEDEKWWKMPLI